jgi:hypothetical protein
MAGVIPASKQVGDPAPPIFVANNRWREEALHIARQELGGTIEDFTTTNGKEMKGLFLSAQEWTKALNLLIPYFRTEHRTNQATKLINSLKEA